MTIGVFFIAMVLGVLMYFTAQQRLIYGWFALLCLSALLRNLFFLISDPQLESLRVAAYFLGSNIQLSAVAALVGCLLSDQHQRFYVYLNALMAAIVTGLEQPAELSHDDSSSHTAKRIPVSRHRSGTLARTAAAAVGRIKCAFKFDLNAEYDTDVQSIMPVGSFV